MRSPSFKEAIVPNVLSNIYQQFTGVTNSYLLFRRRTCHMRLASRYGISNMNKEGSRGLHAKLIPQGKSRDIGQTELKNITPEFLLRYIVSKIHLKLILMFPKIHLSNATVFLFSIPGNEFPWFNLVNHIYKAGQLGRLIQELHKSSGLNPSNCFDNPVKSFYYIAIASFYIQESEPVYGKFVLLSNYKDSDILSYEDIQSSSITTNYYLASRLLIRPVIYNILGLHV